MNVTINGQVETTPQDSTVEALLMAQGLEPKRVAIEINERLVRRTEFQHTVLQEGDRIEIVTLVGGG